MVCVFVRLGNIGPDKSSPSRFVEMKHGRCHAWQDNRIHHTVLTRLLMYLPSLIDVIEDPHPTTKGTSRTTKNTIYMYDV